VLRNDSPRIKKNGSETVENFKFDKKKLSIARKHFTNRWLFNRKMFFQIPLNFIAGIRIKQLNEESCEIAAPYNWITKIHLSQFSGQS